MIGPHWNQRFEHEILVASKRCSVLYGPYSIGLPYSMGLMNKVTDQRHIGMGDKGLSSFRTGSVNNIHNTIW